MLLLDDDRMKKNVGNSRAVVNSVDRNVARVGSDVGEASLMLVAKSL